MGITSRNWFSSFSQNLKDRLARVDLVMLFIVSALVIFGLLMVYSSSFIYAHDRAGDGFLFIRKQLIFAVLGFVALFCALMIDYRKWVKWSYPCLIGATVFLFLVFIPGVGIKAGGAQRWINLGFFQVQPGEIAKLCVVLFVARQLYLKRDKLQTLASGLFTYFLLPLPALILLLIQPDFGTVVIISSVIFCLMFLAGVPFRYLFASLLCAAGAGAWLILGSSYRSARLMSFLDPWQDPTGNGFQILQSLVGFSNGGLLGSGLGNGKGKLFFLPEAHNDFIFAVVGEEMGFVGVFLLVLIFSLFIYRGLKIGWECFTRRGDRFGLLLAVGLTLILGIQGFVNMMVVIGMLPTKGLTLPFVSYGGSALLINLFAVGIILSVSSGSTDTAPIASRSRLPG